MQAQATFDAAQFRTTRPMLRLLTAPRRGGANPAVSSVGPTGDPILEALRTPARPTAGGPAAPVTCWPCA